jgi:hypothetical protein
MSVTNPQRIQIINRRKEQKKWRRTKEWRAFVDLHAHQPDSECAHCHRKHLQRTVIGYNQVRNTHLTINHTSRRKYESFEEYITWDDDCEVCCTTCNWMFEKGMKPCPKCGERYIHWMDSECNTCYYKAHPAKLEEREKKQAKFDKLKRDIKKQKNANDRAFRKKLKATQKPEPIRDWDGRIFPDA